MAIGVGAAIGGKGSGVRGVSAEIGSAVKTCDFTAETNGNSNYGNTWTYATDFSVTNAANNNAQWAYCKFGGKGGSSTSSTKSITSSVKTGPITNKIAKFSVVVNGIDNNVAVASSYLYVYSDSSYSTQIERVSMGTSYSSGTLNAEPASSDYWYYSTGCYYKWEITSTVTGKSNVGVKIDKLIWYEYVVPTYTVSFVVAAASSGYGTVSQSSIASVPYDSSISVDGNKVTINGTTVTASPTADTAQYDYEFSSWTNTSGTITAARTITANFTRTIRSYSVGGTIEHGSLSSTSSVEYGSALNITINPDTNYKLPDTLTSVTMGGSAYAGYTYNSGTGAFSIASVTGAVVINATCDPVGTAYTVTYNANSGTVSPASEQVVENGHPSFPTPTRSGYNFKGWQVNGSGTAYTDPEDYTVTADVTFVASWAILYTVTFNSNGGSSTPAAKSVETGSTFTFPSAGTKTHYTFSGWKSPSDENLYDVGEASPAVTAAITYTAQWAPDAQYDVTYTAGEGGSGSFVDEDQWSGSYTLKAFANLTGVSANSGYQFVNYSVGGVAKNPGDTITLSAATSITVNFDQIPPSDNITYSKTSGIRGTSTSSWGNAGSVTDTTGATYYLNSMGVSSTSSAVRWNQNGYLYATSAPSGMKLKSVSIASISANKSISVYASNDAYTEAPSGTALGSLSSDSLSYTFESNYSYIALKGTSSSTEVGTITITYDYLPRLSSVTTSGQTATFTQDAKFSYGGTLTAHYTKGKADAPVTPSSFKYAATDDIDPTNAGTIITTNTSMDVDTHNGKYIYVIYTEDAITKWVCYQIGVNYAAVTSVVIGTHAAEIGLGETYDASLVTVTVNPSNAAQNVLWKISSRTGAADASFNSEQKVLTAGSAEGTVTLQCYSAVNDSKYDELVVTIVADPLADFTPTSVSGFTGKNSTIAFTYSNMDDSELVSFTSTNTSAVTIGSYTLDGEGNGSVTVNFVGEGSSNVSIHYDGSEALDTITVTVEDDYVTALNWTASNITVYSGAVLPVSIENTWNVNYKMASEDTGNIKYSTGDYKVKLGGQEITLPHTWGVADDGKTLCVEYMGFSSSTINVDVTQTIRPVNKTTVTPATSQYELINSTSDLTAGQYLIVSVEDSLAFDGSLSKLDAGRNNFAVTITDGVIANDSTVSGKYFTLSVSNDEWTITSASGGSVAHSGSKNGMDGSGTNSISIEDGIATIIGTGGKGLAYNSVSGESNERFRYYTSPATDNNHGVSLFKLVEDPGSSVTVDIANQTGHEAAQKAVVKFAKAFNAAMDTTENCSTNMSSAWSTASAAWTTFLSEAAALGSTEEAYAKDLIACATAQWTEGTDNDYEYCLERAMATYERCVKLHGMTAFMSTVRPVPAGRVSPYANIITKNVNVALIVIITSVISVAAVGGYFFLRKKKEQ